MIFTLEATNAAAGDSLVLHYDRDGERRVMLIDGGPTGNYRDRLRERLDALRQELSPNGPLPLQLLMVSHIDDDHVAGVLDLVNDCIRALDRSEDPICEVNRMWHNSFGGLLGDEAEAVAGEAEPAQLETPETAAVVASVGQGAELQDSARRLGAEMNEGREVISATDDDVLVIDVDGIEFTVIAPAQKQLDNLRKLWAKDLPKARERAAEISAYLDKTVPNLSSIVVLVRREGKSMLLTGDARGDLVLKNLETAGLVEPGGALEVDVLKLPHHGSDRNVATDFFRRVRARHYVVSADGKHGNPENATLLMIDEARPGEQSEYTIHLTNRDGKEGLGDRLTTLIEDREKAGKPLPLSFRDDAEPSIWIDLLDPVPH